MGACTPLVRVFVHVHTYTGGVYMLCMFRGYYNVETNLTHSYPHVLCPIVHSEAIPKCLLPIANRELLAYQLDVLARSGVLECYIITPPSYNAALQVFLSNYLRRIRYVVCYERMGRAWYGYEECIVQVP